MTAKVFPFTPSANAGQEALLRELRDIVGRREVLIDGAAAKRHSAGFRFGSGTALAVVRPGTLVEQWRVLLACVAAKTPIIFQAANTGLTGGSTPFGEYDQPPVIVNMMRLDAIHLISSGTQAICLPGSTLYALEDRLAPLNREPHSVIGSSCIGASIIGGVCNNSGGALIHRGPAYTECAMFAQIGTDGRVELVNHLGISIDGDPETILQTVETGTFSPDCIDEHSARMASDARYARHVRDINAITPSRFNADPSRLFEASGCAGKLAVFAVRLDTFAAEAEPTVFYIGTNSPLELAELRRDMLGGFKELPIAAEYMHRAAYNIAERYGKDMFLAISWLGTARLPRLFAFKAKFDALLARIGSGGSASDRILQFLSKLAPRHLPHRMNDFRDRFEHHLMLKVAGSAAREARDYLVNKFPSTNGDFFECDSKEAKKAFLQRFAAAGAAVRYREIHRSDVEDIVALDIALPRNSIDWFERLPEEVDKLILHKLYYGHFFCHVFHQDYVLAKGVDVMKLEHRMHALLDERGAEYPAEHNVGHLYAAKPPLAEFYRSLDPRNLLNPGIGHTSRLLDWN